VGDKATRGHHAIANFHVAMQYPRSRTATRNTLAALIFTAALLGGCAQLPPLEPRSISVAPTQAETRDTPLGRELAPMIAVQAGKSGVYPLTDPYEAFSMRMKLVGSAQRTLDVQYYIWHRDLTGTLLFQALRDAQARGVRVRLLLDDLNTEKLDATLAALDDLPGIEVRLFNPLVYRSLRWRNYLFDFHRINRRMHNKSITADNQLSIVGGRNIGDEYFGATHGVLFSDLDVLAAGPIVGEISADFDRYWASASSYPAKRLLAQPPRDELDTLSRDARAMEKAMRAAQMPPAEPAHAWAGDELASLARRFEWTTVHLVSDDPGKGQGAVPANRLLTSQLDRILGTPKESVYLVSAYLVPTSSGVKAFENMVRRGVHVEILTNSLDATDVAAVHAGYARRRSALLRAGVRLYELKRTAPGPALIPQNRTRFRLFSHSGSSLHAKTFAVDGRRVFVGSFNFDPRSARLNTELGVIIDSPALARQIAEAFRQQIPQQAYEVRLTPGGHLYWLERKGESSVRHDTEPETTAIQRLLVDFIAVFPIEWLL